MNKTIKKIIFILLGAMTIGVFCFFAIQLYVNAWAKDYMVLPETAPNAEAVIVLGAKVDESGNPSPLLADRLDYGYELYQNKTVKKILVSGDHGTKEYDEVNVMKDYLLKKGVPREDIFLDHAGFDTYDSMYRAKTIFGIETMMISTQQFHMSRSIYIARKMGIDAYGYPCKDKEIYKMEYLKFRESLAKIKAFVDTDILKRQSKYLGDTISIMGDGIVTQD